MMSPRTRLLSAGALLTATLLTPACRPPGSRAAAASATSPAASTYVAPGAKDQFYMLYSGGHSGQVYVAGLPSMRHIATIPVFARYPATGYGYDEESRKMLGEFTWGDMHHPGLSQTDGRYDGRCCSSTIMPTTASRASTCATSRPSRSSVRFQTPAGPTAPR